MRALIVLSLLFLASCSPKQWNEKLSTPEDRALALKTIANLRSGNINELQSVMEPQLYLQTLAARQKIKELLLVDGEPELVTVNSTPLGIGSKPDTTKAMNYEFGTRKKWVVFQVVLKPAGARTEVIGWNLNPFSKRPTTIGDFSFDGRGAIYYFWIVAMLLSTATILTALVLVARSKGIKRRWLWIVGCLFGLGQFSLNWSTGIWVIRPMAFFMLGSAAMKASPFDPWILSFSLPIIAIVFLARRSQLLASQRQREAIETSSDF